MRLLSLKVLLKTFKGKKYDAEKLDYFMFIEIF